MIHLTITNFLFVLLGLALHIIIRMIKCKKKFNGDFSIIFYLKDNILQVLASGIMAFIVFYFADSITQGGLDIHVHADSHYYKVFAVAAGYNNHVLFDEFMKTNGTKSEK